MSVIEKLNVERDLGNRAFEIIKNYVIRPDTPLGTRFYEERISRDIGVSRTPVRVALHRLEQEGLVEIISNRGAPKRPMWGNIGHQA